MRSRAASSSYHCLRKQECQRQTQDLVRNFGQDTVYSGTRKIMVEKMKRKRNFLIQNLNVLFQKNWLLLEAAKTF